MAYRLVRSTRYSKNLVGSRSAYFPGSGTACSVPVTLSSTGFSMGFWINQPNTGGWYFTTSTNTNTNGMNFLYNNNRFEFFIWNNTSSVAVPTTTAGEIIANKWYFVTLTYKVNETKLYVNSTQKGSTDTSCTMSDGSSALWLVRRHESGNFNIGKGYICNLTIQNTTTPWTVAQITDLQYRNTIPSGAVQYTFNNTALDQNGANAATLTGASYVDFVPSFFGTRSSATRGATLARGTRTAV